MKQTVTANIAGFAFVMEDDAYDLLSDYLRDIECRLVAQHDYSETLKDVEIRIMELLKESGISDVHVVTVPLVKEVIATIGNPSVFGDKPQSESRHERWSRPSDTPLRRPRKDRMIAGVCAGLARYWNIDINILRFATVLLAIFWGASFLCYVILWIVIPEETISESRTRSNTNRFRK